MQWLVGGDSDELARLSAFTEGRGLTFSIDAPRIRRDMATLVVLLELLCSRGLRTD